jgi:hypothetical protein
MMKHGTMDRNRLQNLVALLVLIVLMWFAWGCGDDSRMPGQTTGTTSVPNAETASASLTILWHTTPGISATASLEAASLDCQASHVEHVVCKVYNASGNELVIGGPWPCAAKSGQLDRVPVGQGHMFVVLAEDANGDVRYHGETRGITIEAGSAPQSVVVNAYPFIPTVISPEDNAVIDLADLSLGWNPLENAEAYLVQVALDVDFQTIVVNETTPATPYAPPNLERSTTYFWRISAVDPYTHVSVASQTRTFITSDAPAVVISGTIHTSGGAAVSGVVVTFSNGDEQVTVTTDTAGAFSKAVQHGWSGSATPSKNGWQFLPASISFQNVTADQAGRDFTATPITFIIAGVVEEEITGAGIDEVTITFSDGSTVTTDASGAYSKTVPYGWNGTATPTKDGWNFNPTSMLHQNVTADQIDRNFTATPTSLVISGVIEHENTGDGIDDVTITFSDGSTVITDASGAYRKTVPYGWNGSATPTRAGWNFNPPSMLYENITVNQTDQNFTAIPTNVIITGVVAEQENNSVGIGDVTISFSDDSTVTTDASGAYSKTVPYGWTGSATPSKNGWNFNPATIPYQNITSDQTDQNYTGTPIRPVISGYVRDPEHNGIPGINLSLSSGQSVTTDPSGAWRVEVPYEWSGSVTPTTEGYDYSPIFIEHPGVTADLAGQDFIATPIRPVISGYIRTRDNDYPMNNVIVTFSNGGGTATTEGGYYAMDLPYGWSGTATPSLPGTGWQFAPPSRTYVNVTEDQPDQNYNGSIDLDDDD